MRYVKAEKTNILPGCMFVLNTMQRYYVMGSSDWNYAGEDAGLSKQLTMLLSIDQGRFYMFSPTIGLFYLHYIDHNSYVCKFPAESGKKIR